MLSRISAISKKELKQIFRDKRSLLILFVLPLFLLVLFGYAITLDIRNIKLGIYDNDKSEVSRSFIKTFSESPYFKIVTYLSNEREINEVIDRGIVQCVIVIPQKFSEDLGSNKNVKVQFLIDGVDANTASLMLGYVNAATAFYSGNYVNEFLEAKGIHSHSPLKIEPQYWYNKELNTTLYFIPGLISMILIIISVILASVSIVREKELGTIDQIRVSPVSGIELILGKIFPYMSISLVIASAILFLGYVLFGVEVKGSYLMLIIGTICYLFVTLSIGVLISTVAESQQVAFQMSQMISQLPTAILSGFMFPIESMPIPIRILSYLTPARYYIKILRDILIKGVGLEAYKMEILCLVIFATVLITIAVIRIRKSNA